MTLVASPVMQPVFAGPADSPGLTLAKLGSVAFTTQPVGAASASPLTTQPVVTVRNILGATDTTFTGNVTVTLSGTGALSGTVTKAAVAGVATFTDLVITGAGASNLNVTLPGRGSAISNAITTS